MHCRVSTAVMVMRRRHNLPFYVRTMCIFFLRCLLLFYLLHRHLRRASEPETTSAPTRKGPECGFHCEQNAVQLSFVQSKGKVNVVPLQARCVPEGSRRFRLPDFHDIRYMEVVRSSASRTGRL